MYSIAKQSTHNLNLDVNLDLDLDDLDLNFIVFLGGNERCIFFVFANQVFMVLCWGVCFSSENLSLS